jgi:hypothetical protein
MPVSIEAPNKPLVAIYFKEVEDTVKLLILLAHLKV